MDNRYILNNASTRNNYNGSPEINTNTTASFTDEIHSATATNYNTSSDYLQSYNYWDYFDYILKEKIPPSLKLTYIYSQQYVTLLIFLLAVFGNALIVCIMLQRKNRRLSTSTFFLSLAIADLTISFDSLNRGLATNGFHVFEVSTLGCKVNRVFLSIIVSCRVASSWTLVAMTIERMLSVCIPHKVKIFCTLPNARIKLTFIWIFSFLIGFLNTYLAGSVFYDPKRVFCFLLDNKFSNFYLKYYVWFIFSIEVLIPWFNLLLMSIIVIAVLKKGRSQVSTNARDNYITIIILTAVIVFLITQFSYSFFMLYSTLVYESVSLQTYLYYTYFDNILLIYKDINCALNFYMYFLTGSRFRKESKLLILFFCINLNKIVRERSYTKTPVRKPTTVDSDTTGKKQS